MTQIREVNIPPRFGLVLLELCSLAALFLVLIRWGLASGLSAIGRNKYAGSLESLSFLPVSLAFPGSFAQLSFNEVLSLLAFSLAALAGVVDVAVDVRGGSSLVFFKWARQS